MKIDLVSKRKKYPFQFSRSLLDNALDHVETPAVNNSRSEFIPEIDVKISSNTDRINLEVSNPVITSRFTLKRIHSILDFYNFSSTKRNQYKISRGALGNGLKAILGMSYALAVEHYNHDNWNPVNIRTENKLYSIVLIVDKVNGKDRPIYTDIKSEECVSNNNIAHTAVAIDIPTDNNSQTKTLNKLVDTFKNYTILNPHITMHITLNGKLTSFPRVQKVKSDWNNLDNIYHYSFTEFENLLFSVSKGKVTIYDFVRNIRLTQFSKLNKHDWHIPINEIQHDKTVAT